jgi:hypothetical protein
MHGARPPLQIRRHGVLPNGELYLRPVTRLTELVYAMRCSPAAVHVNSDGKPDKGQGFVCSAWNAVCTHAPLSSFVSRHSFVLPLPARVRPTPAPTLRAFPTTKLSTRGEWRQHSSYSEMNRLASHYCCFTPGEGDSGSLGRVDGNPVRLARS